MSKKSQKLLALPVSDDTLDAPSVLTSWAMVPGLARKIEQAGHGYAEMQYNRVHGKPVLEEPKEEEEKSP